MLLPLIIPGRVRRGKSEPGFDFGRLNELSVDIEPKGRIVSAP